VATRGEPSESGVLRGREKECRKPKSQGDRVLGRWGGNPAWNTIVGNLGPKVWEGQIVGTRLSFGGRGVGVSPTGKPVADEDAGIVKW